LQHSVGLQNPVCRKQKKEALAQCSASSLFPTLSILRKALDKIAEIKSLLEERRIGEWKRRHMGVS
jgi:hypothetical protein